ncbi:MAG: RDD family protein [Chloroflexi bacterium]|nr:RDD family protein [Chloroflexota bacterium]MCY4247570.1 RDD family protein [Chloroflexota bacterium]
MADRLADIQRALDEFRMDEARALAAEELAEKPSAAAYYLASLAARNHGQRGELLQKALEHDPEHAQAKQEWRDMQPPAARAPASAEPDAKEAPPQLAGLTKRFAALLFDAAITSAMTLLVLLINDSFAPLQDALYSADETAATAAFRHFQQSTILYNLVINAFYQTAFMTSLNGRTPGKMIFNLRVVKQSGKRITILDALLRNGFGYTVSQLFLLGFIWAWVDDNQQAWHDKMAGTIVIDLVPAEAAETPAD